MTVLFGDFDKGGGISPLELDEHKRFTLLVNGWTFELPEGADKVIAIKDRVYVRFGEGGGWLFLDRNTDELIRIDELIRDINGHALSCLSIVTHIDSLYAYVRRTYTNGGLFYSQGTELAMDAPVREDTYVLNNRGDGLLVAGRKNGPLYFPTGVTKDGKLVQIQGKWHAVNPTAENGIAYINDNINQINGVYFRVEGVWKIQYSGEYIPIEKSLGDNSPISDLRMQVYEGVVRSIT